MIVLAAGFVAVVVIATVAVAVSEVSDFVVEAKLKGCFAAASILV